MSVITVREHTFHSKFIDAASRVIDLGANEGEFSQEVVSLFGCQSVAVEPSPDIFAAIPEKPSIIKKNLAVAAEQGEVDFFIHPSSVKSSMIDRKDPQTRKVKVKAVRLDDLVVELKWSGVDLVKMDVEGLELSIMESLSDDFIRGIKQFTIEIHDFNGLVAKRDVRRLKKRMKKLGFFWLRMSRIGHYDTWMINRAKCDIDYSEYLWAKLWTRNWNGLKRMLKRYFPL